MYINIRIYILKMKQKYTGTFNNYNKLRKVHNRQARRKHIY